MQCNQSYQVDAHMQRVCIIARRTCSECAKLHLCNMRIWDAGRHWSCRRHEGDAFKIGNTLCAATAETQQTSPGLSQD